MPPTGQWKVLFATLASTGLLCGEAFGLHVADLGLTTGRIYVRRSIWNGEEVSVKTKRGHRTVTIEPVLIGMLAAHIGQRKGLRVFQTRNGTPFCKGNARRKLNQILKKLNLAPAGLHAFRHGRVSVLQANGVPGDLVKEWVGHSNLRTTSRYTHFGDDFRKQVGLFAQASVAEKLPPTFGNTVVRGERWCSTFDWAEVERARSSSLGNMGGFCKRMVMWPTRKWVDRDWSMRDAGSIADGVLPMW
jgi:hypothetical protein